MNTNIDESWKNILQSEFKKDSFKSLTKFIKSEYQNHQCYPDAKNIFAAFNLCNYSELKVVIIGQDPYHGKGQANGLCFSVLDNISHPPSLKNIIKEMYVVDHIIPKQDGGTENESNLQSLCRRCHAKKTGKETYERIKNKKINIDDYKTIFYILHNFRFTDPAIDKFLSYLE